LIEAKSLLSGKQATDVLVFASFSIGRHDVTKEALISNHQLESFLI